LDLRRNGGLLHREGQKDSTGRALAYVYYEEEAGRRTSVNLLTKDEARRVASNIAKLPNFRMGGARS
jgi:hypothetical protein